MAKKTANSTNIKKSNSNSDNTTYKMGWLPDYPDMRDYGPDHELIKPLLEKTKIPALDPNKQLPTSADISKWCTPVRNQGDIGSCTAHAAGALVEYFENKAFGKYFDASPLFLYKVSRNLLDWKEDTGMYCRTMLGALVAFGVPPEKYWPYEISEYNTEPSAFCYSLAQNYQTTRYFRLDTPGLSPQDLLSRAKEYLSVGIPFMFGFTVYKSYKQSKPTGKIPFPSGSESISGTHCIMAVGYDDSIQITNNVSGQTTVGAIYFKNSWGESWGINGFGWLPYDYITNGLAEDFWCVLSSEWLDIGEFL